MAKKKDVASVDMASLDVQMGTEVDIDNIVTPSLDVSEMYPEINDMRTKPETDKAENMPIDADDAPIPTHISEDGTKLRVFYHRITRQYMPYNENLANHDAFVLQEVSAQDYAKLMAKMGHM